MMESGAVVPGARISSIDERGKSLFATSDANGTYGLGLVPGIYSISVATPGFLTIKDGQFFVVKSTLGKMSLDFVMFGAKYHEPCGYSGAACLPAEALIKSYEIVYSPKLRELNRIFNDNDPKRPSASSLGSAIIKGLL